MFKEEKITYVSGEVLLNYISCRDMRSFILSELPLTEQNWAVKDGILYLADIFRERHEEETIHLL